MLSLRSFRKCHDPSCFPGLLVTLFFFFFRALLGGPSLNQQHPHLPLEKADEVMHEEDADALVVAGSAIVEESTLVADSWLDVFCDHTHKWYPAKIVKEDRARENVLVQFHGWSERHNTWVPKVGIWR